MEDSKGMKTLGVINRKLENIFKYAKNLESDEIYLMFFNIEILKNKYLKNDVSRQKKLYENSKRIDIRDLIMQATKAI